MKTLQKITETLYVASKKLRLVGLPILTRMCVIKLSSGKLWVWAPFIPDESLKKEIDQLGEVAEVVSPNSFHHLFVKEFKALYPNAITYAPSELQEKKKDFQFDQLLRDDATESWREEIDYRVFRGSKFYSEALFLHKQSRTLIVTDLLIQTKRTTPLADLFWYLYGVLKEPSSSPFCKLLTRERIQTRAIIDQILEWDFDRVVMAHGKVIETGGREKFRGSLKWLKST